VCVVETSKASVEVESPADGTLVRLHAEGEEVELGAAVALVADDAAEAERERDRRHEGQQAAAPRAGPANATRKAVELAEMHGVDLAEIDKAGFITAEDVEALVAARGRAAPAAADLVLGGVAVDGLTLPATFEPEGGRGRLDEGFLARLRDDPESVRALPPDEKLEAYRRGGAAIGERVTLGDGTLIVARRIVVEDDVSIGPGGNVACDEVFAVGRLTGIGAGLDLSCRRAFIGENGWIQRSVEIGGGGRHDRRSCWANTSTWATGCS
jgi:hypothetical protein